MKNEDPSIDHALEFLLAFDGRTHWFEQGYYLKFEIRRVPPSPLRPHGLRYSFTLHDGEGKRLIGFDNAHSVRPPGTKFKTRAPEADHWHRTGTDKGRPYQYEGAEKLIDDFFREVRRTLQEHGISEDVIADKQERTEP